MLEPRIQYAKTSDGVSIAYWTMGEGPPLVALAPSPRIGSEIVFRLAPLRRWINLLSANRTVVRVDHRGFGNSDRAATDYSLHARTLDLGAAVDSLGLDQFALLGLAQSGLTAIAYAARHPERVSHLVLYSASARGTDYFQSARELALWHLAEADWNLYTEVEALTLLGWSAGDDGAIYAASLRESATPEAARASRDVTAEIDVSDLLPQIQAPTLVLHPREAPPSVDAARSLAAGIPNARLAILEGAGARLLMDDPERLTQAILGFLNEASEPPSEAVVSLSASVVTILFTDLASSTALTQRLGDAKAQELVRAHNSIVREALAAHGGSEIKHTGDGIMASFPTASGALECAVAIQRNVAQHADGDLQVHIGLNAGEPVAEESDLFGTSVQLARRICDHAEPGQILVSNVVRELSAGKGFLFADIGEVVPKGFEEPVRLYEVRWRE